MIKRFTLYLKNVIKIISKPVMSILPGQLAFSFVLTIIPLIVLLTFIASSFSISLDTITNFVSGNFPDAVGKLLLPLINGRGFDFNILIFMITAFWLASGGATSIITASDVIYEIKPQKYIPKKIKSFIMTFILIVLIIFMFVVPAFGNSILNLLKNINVFESISREVLIGYYLLRYPLSFFIIYTLLKLIYTMAPNKSIKSVSVTSGAVFTTIAWMLITELYSFWVVNISHYDIFYGGISSIIILLIWMYFLSSAFAIGLVMNAEKSIEMEASNERNK